MSNETRNALQQEWSTLQKNYEHSETLALTIKLIAVIISFTSIVLQQNSVLITLLLLVLWLQESIWKTFQSRTEHRLLIIEKAWAENNEDSVLCYYSNWAKSRPGIKQLIASYVSSALKPTVAFPYLILVFIHFIQQFLY